MAVNKDYDVSTGIRDREAAKFVADKNNEVAVNVLDQSASDGAYLARALQMAELLIKGTVPDVNYDEIVEIEVSATARTLEFKFEGLAQFYIDATNLFSSNQSVKFRSSNFLLIDDTGDRLLIDDGGDLLLRL